MASPVSDRLSCLDPSLLAEVVSACPAEALLALEVALGPKVGKAVKDNATHRLTWLQVLAEDAGLRGRLCSPADLPDLAELKAAWRQSRCSTPLQGGWHETPARCWSKWADSIRDLHAEFPDGRSVFARGESKPVGVMHRLALVHFDVSGCFSSEAWRDIVQRFQSSGQTPLSVNHVTSTSVKCDLEGVEVPLALTLSGFTSLSSGGDPCEGVGLGLDHFAFHDYFEQVQQGRRLLLTQTGDYRNCELLHVSYLLHCGEGLTRTGCTLMRVEESSPGAVEMEYRRPWCLAPYPNFGLKLDISVCVKCENGIERKFLIDEEICNAEWNRALSSTPLARLVHDPSNEFAVRPFDGGPRAMEGSILLARRGAGCGFAQKALAAQEAGAVGCIIYEAAGDRKELGNPFLMGLHFGGRDYPAPTIPCVLVGAEAVELLLDAALDRGVATARIGLASSSASLRTPPQSFQAFAARAAAGEPVHVAALMERFVAAAPLTRAEYYGLPLSWITGKDL